MRLHCTLGQLDTEHLKSIHVIPSIAEESSGPSYSVSRLVKSMIDLGAPTTLAAMDWSPIASPPAFLKTFPIGRGPKRLGRSPMMYRWLKRQTRSGNIRIIHNHGMWQMNAIYPSRIAKANGIPFVSSPRGAFSEWAMNHGSNWKRIFWFLLQRPALLNSACFHATAETELADIRRLGFKQPVSIIPNGIDIPEKQSLPKLSPRTLLFLGRIHPVKGLDMLLPAWKTVEDRFPEWQLKIVGSDVGYGGPVGYSQEMKNLSRKLQIKRIEFLGEVRGNEKQGLLQQSELFVLPSYSENFGISVAESLASGTPAVVTKGAPWQNLNRFNAGWHVNTDVESLVGAFQDALSLAPGRLSEMGENGRKMMIEFNSWERIGSMMLETYAWLLSPTAPRPSWVELA